MAFVPDLFGQALNGLAYGVLLFLLSVGLTLIFGMLDVVNLAHGSYYMLGAYAGLSLIAATGNFWLALLVAPLAVGVVGLAQYIIRRNSVDMGRFTIEGSRPFSSLKPWASLKIIGREGYRLLFKSAQANALSLKRILDDRGNFESLNSPELFILIYRFVPRRGREKLHAWQEEKRILRNKAKMTMLDRNIKKVNQIVNALNIKLHKALRQDDTTFVSRTTLESTRYHPLNIVVLRAILINPFTDEAILKEIVETQNRIGTELWRGFESAYKKVLAGGE